MKHDYFQKKCLCLLGPSPQGQGVSTGKNICYMSLHASIPLNLICNMTIICKKKMNFGLLIPPWDLEGVSTGKIFAVMLLHASFPLI